MADVLNTSQEIEADVGSSQFAELLKPIRELTKQHCWDLNIAEKLDEYVHYIKDLDIEVNVNGEKMKLDFAKAAMVVQNSVQIYSKKVEYLWILLQEVIDSLRTHGSGREGEEGASVGSKIRRNPRKRHQKGEINLLEVGESKYRKANTQNKKKTGVQSAVRKVQILPYEILQLEEAVSSTNPIKIKLYTLAKEHLGYPSDLRANFPFDQKDFFLQIAPKMNNTPLECQQDDFPAEEAMDNNDCSADDAPPPDLDGDYERPESRTGDCEDPAPYLELGNDPSVRDEMEEEAVERMQLRPRDTPPANQEQEPARNLDPWQSLEIYVDMSIRKPVGTLPTTKLPLTLQNNRRKRKEVGKDAASVEDDVVPHIHEFLSDKMVSKKATHKLCQPEGEYWEEYVFYSKSVGAAAKKHLKTRSAGNVTIEDLDETSEHDDRGDAPEPDDRPDLSFNDDPRDDFHFDGGGMGGNEVMEDRDGDEAASKDFYEILQQQMAEYMATAKAFVSSTESTRRVQAWHDMIRPRLVEAESRRDFDIHEYGSQILSVFGSEAPVGSLTRFSQVVGSQPRNEVARYFLATLQLANAYNVEIESESNSMSVDGIQLKLLSRERHHEHMDEFR